MRIEQIRHFLEVAKCNSIAQAAENLLIGKSTLSNSINSLEDELEEQLFVRTTKGTFLTPFGENIITYANEILLSTDKIHAMKQAGTIGNVDALHLYSYPAGSISVMVELLIYMKKQFPGINVYVTETRSENILQELISSGRNIGVSAASPLSYHYIKINAENHDYICEPVYEDKIYVYVHKTHPWSNKKSIDLSQLETAPVGILKLFLVTTDNAFYHEFKGLQERYVADNYELLKKLVLRNELVAVAPSLAFYDSNWEEIVQIPLTGCSAKFINFLIYKKNTASYSTFEVAALDFLRNFYREIT